MSSSRRKLLRAIADLETIEKNAPPVAVAAAAPAALDALFQRGGTSRRTRLLSERPKGIAGAEPAAGAKSKKVKTWRKRFRARIRAG